MIDQRRDVNIEIRLRISGQDWYGNHLHQRDILLEIREALDEVLKVQRYQSIKVYMDKFDKEE